MVTTLRFLVQDYQPSYNKRARGESLWAKLVIALVFLSTLALTLWLWRREAAPVVNVGELQGDPIVPLSTNTPGASKKVRYKPGSLPQRLVQFQYRVERQGLTSAFSAELKMDNLPPGFVIYTNDVSLPTSLVPDNRGYVTLGFDYLSGFPFALEPDLADGRRNPALAGEKVRAQIPEHIRRLDQRLVRLRGFLVPVRMDEELAVEFLLMRDQTLCCYGKVPRVNEWVHVQVKGRGVKPIMDIPITVEGLLRVGDRWENGYFAGIYFLHANSAAFDRRE
ncbi:DUF3299 domain-containing protein [Fontisphaera persica]|uniref:DUF3299 domain-containing protein n=1 Tax=Fontisphaera persica TaxID=2974023 RepID=UPI0024BF4835|nr:DUF3299 domain-containing protein [Fontisphaera persica]WCJ60282.1 DUF3299 domain-containing protein [Fontisphaera persica]